MKTSKIDEQQIAHALRGAESGRRPADVWQPLSVSEARFHIWEEGIRASDRERAARRSQVFTDAMNVFLTYAAATWGKDAFEAVHRDVLAGVAAVAAQTPTREFFPFVLLTVFDNSQAMSTNGSVGLLERQEF